MDAHLNSALWIEKQYFIPIIVAHFIYDETAGSDSELQRLVQLGKSVVFLPKITNSFLITFWKTFMLEDQH